MFPPLFAILNATPAVKAVFGTAPLRVYPHGEAPAKGAAGYALPYAVFQTVSGSPENYMNQAPDSDDFGVQVDVYAASVTAARNGAKAIRDAIEQPQLAYVVGWNGESKDPDTGNFRYSFDVDFITPR